MKKYIHTLYDLDNGSPESYGNFNPVTFSKLKYGDGLVAHDYANKLCDLLEKDLEKDKDYNLTGSAYQDIPTAAVSVAFALFNALRSKGFRVTYTPIRGLAFTHDYSNMLFEDREKIITQNELSFKDIPGQKKIQNIIVVDDIRVTGLHEYAIERFLNERGDVLNAHFVYIAMLNEGVKETDPRIEWRLNHAHVNNLEKLVEIMRGDVFYPNARICKFILAAQKNDLSKFLKTAPADKLRHLQKLIRQEGYDKIDCYRDNYLFLEHHLPLHEASMTSSSR